MVDKFFVDTRNGLGYRKSFSIQYEGLRNIGKDSQGFDRFIYFAQVPWTILRVTNLYIGTEEYWEEKILEMISDYERFGFMGTGEFIETVEVGERLIIEGEEYYSGSITVADYRNGVGDFPGIYNRFEYSNGNISPGGYWDDNDRSFLHRQAFFSQNNFGEVGNKSYTAREAEDTVGERKTIGGVEGIVSSVTKSNPRYINNELVYDFQVQLAAKRGTEIEW